MGRAKGNLIVALITILPLSSSVVTLSYCTAALSTYIIMFFLQYNSAVT